MSMWRNDIKWKYMGLFHLRNLARPIILSYAFWWPTYDFDTRHRCCFYGTVEVHQCGIKLLAHSSTSMMQLNLGVDKLFHPTLHCDMWLFIHARLKLLHVDKRNHSRPREQELQLITFELLFQMIFSTIRKVETTFTYYEKAISK